MITQLDKRVETRTRAEAEDILWGSRVQRPWERGPELASQSPVVFPEYDVAPLVPNPVAPSPAQVPAFLPKPQFQSYIKPGELAGKDTGEKIMEVEATELVQEDEIERVAIKGQDEDVKFKLNARGIIAIGTFFATVVLVTVLIILNASTISASSSRISTLRDENSVLRANVSQTVAQRNELYTDVTNNIDTGEFVELPEPVRVPRMNQLRQQNENPDHSTNWFDRLSRWLGSLFGRG